MLRRCVLLVITFCWARWTYAQLQIPIEEGLASFYHARFHGRKSASGQYHNSEELTAAHRKHPFGTFLRVTNLKNMKSVIVCVTDRGPFRRGRIIDVSQKAAEKLDFIKEGITRVRLEVVPSADDLKWLDLMFPVLPIPHLKTDLPVIPPPLRLN